MNEKVKLTKEQANAIEYFRKTFIENPKTSMSNETLIAALNHGYEVEPEFKVGDWVIYDDQIVRIKDVFTNNTVHTPYLKNFIVEGIDKWFDLERVERHATPEEIAAEKERRWWSKHGREVWELKVGDVLLNRDNELCEVTGKSDLNVFINDKPQQGSTVGSYGFKVVCFAEDRKDI